MRHRFHLVEKLTHGGFDCRAFLSAFAASAMSGEGHSVRGPVVIRARWDLPPFPCASEALPFSSAIHAFALKRMKTGHGLGAARPRISSDALLRAYARRGPGALVGRELREIGNALVFRLDFSSRSTPSLATRAAKPELSGVSAGALSAASCGAQIGGSDLVFHRFRVSRLRRKVPLIAFQVSCLSAERLRPLLPGSGKSVPDPDWLPAPAPRLGNMGFHPPFWFF